MYKATVSDGNATVTMEVKDWIEGPTMPELGELVRQCCAGLGFSEFLIKEEFGESS